MHANKLVKVSDLPAYCNMTPESQNSGLKSATDTSTARQWGTVCCDCVMKCHCDATMFTHYMKGSSEVVVTQCGRVMAVQLEGPLEAVGSLTETDFMAAHQVGVYMVRMPVQHSREVLVRMVGDCWLHKDTSRTAPPEDHGRLKGQP